MELSPQFLIDFSINLGGYILAAVLGGLLYRIINGNPKIVPAAVTENVPVKPVTVPESVVEEKPVAAKTEMDFISFAQKTPANTKPVKNEIDDIVAAPPKKNPNRNRKEIIQLATKMLNANFTNDRIKELLPVSDGELALISLSKK